MPSVLLQHVLMALHGQISENTILQLLGLIAAIVVPVIGATTIINKTVIAWVLRKLDEKNGVQAQLANLAQQMTANTEAITVLANVLKEVQAGQCAQTEAVQRLCAEIKKA